MYIDLSNLNRKNQIGNIAKIIGFVLLALLLLLVLFIFSLRLEGVQNVVKKQVVRTLEKKIGTDVEVERLFIDWPNKIYLENLLLAGETEDTLLFLGKAEVGLALPALLKNQVTITSIDVERVRANLLRNSDGRFNFDYILDAFTTKQEATKEKNPSKPMIISLDAIELDDIGLKFTDLQSANDLNLFFDHFDTRVTRFDMENNDYALDTIRLAGLRLSMDQDLAEEFAENTEETVDSLAQQAPFSIDLAGVHFTDFDIGYNNAITQQMVDVDFDKLYVDIDDLDLATNSYALNNVVLMQSDITAEIFFKPTGVEPPPIPTILIDNVLLKDVNAVYDNTAYQPVGSGLDFNHLNVQNVNVDASNIRVDEDAYVGNVHAASMTEKSGLSIQQLQTNFLYSSTETSLENLYLRTSRSTIRDEVNLRYPSLEAMANNPGVIQINADINNSVISFRDILLLAPQMRNVTPFAEYPNERVFVDTYLNGTMNNLTIGQFNARGFNNTEVNVSGTVKNAMDVNQLTYDLDIANFSVDSSTIRTFVPNGQIPENIQLPRNISVQGTARGGMKDVNADLQLVTSLGNADVLGEVDMRNVGQERYDIEAKTYNLQVGTLISNQQIGNLTVDIDANGIGFAPETAQSTFEVRVDSAGFNNYIYQDVDLKGELSAGMYDVVVNSQDENATMLASASGSMDQNNPTLSLDGRIDQLDLGALQFTEQPLTFAGNITADFSNLDPDELNGELQLNQFVFSDSKNIYPLDSIYLTAVSTIDSNRLVLRTPILDANIDGEYKLTQLAPAMQRTIDKYYELPMPESLDTMQVDPGQYFTLQATVKNDSLLHRLMPSLSSFEPMKFNANFNADERFIEASASIPEVQMKTLGVENGSFSMQSEGDQLKYGFSIEQLGNEQLQVNALTVEGGLSNNVADFLMTTENPEQEINYRIGGEVSLADQVTTVSLNANQLMLNQDPWSIPDDNKIELHPQGFIVNNFTLSNGESRLAINSENARVNAPLTVDIENFQIRTITELMSADSLLANGLINGNARIEDIATQPQITADLEVRELEVLAQEVGTLTANVKNESASLVGFDVLLTENGNDVQLNGTIQLDEQIADAKLLVNQLTMETVQAFSLGQIEQSEGYISGTVDIEGKLIEPNLNGQLKFNDVSMFVTQLGTRFQNINDDIDMTNQGISLDQFTVSDVSGNLLTIDGEILTNDYIDYTFDLTVDADDFRVVDAEDDIDNQMYGLLAIDAQMVITGNLDLPVVSGTLGVTDETDFYFVLPQATAALQAREGVVEFVDRDQIVLQQSIEVDSLEQTTRIRGMDVSVNIAVDPDALVSIIIDRANGDFVKLKGEGQLNGGVDASGKTTLVGTYEVNEGSYEMTLGFMKRAFDIQEGSTIVWEGDPLHARMNITAVYNTEASPIDLLSQQLADLSSAQYNLYKQRLPFEVMLNLDGDLLEPDITFDIELDGNQSGVSAEVVNNVSAKLNQLDLQESEMNKQVFALLLLNRFIGENPFQSEAGMSAEGLARQSVSRILSEQLNNLAGDLIQGVDLNLNLESTEDYSTGQKSNRTDLNVQLSKRLLNDRLTVNVGSDFGLEGEARVNERTTNIAGDVSVDYDLSQDGRYKLRVYRKNEYQVALQGEIIETGVGFIITLDYDEFKDIFEKRKTNKEIRQELKEEEQDEEE